MPVSLISQKTDGIVARLIFTHTDTLAIVRGPFVIDRPLSEDPTVFLSAWSDTFTQALASAEADADIAQIAILGSLAMPSFQYTTAAIVRTALRAAYQTATQVQAIMIGDFLNTLSDAQLQALFGLTAAQVTSLRTNKLQPAASAASTIRAAVGA